MLLDAEPIDMPNQMAYGIRLRLQVRDDRWLEVPIVWTAVDLVNNNHNGISHMFQALMDNGCRSMNHLLEEDITNHPEAYE